MAAAGALIALVAVIASLAGLLARVTSAGKDASLLWALGLGGALIAAVAGAALGQAGMLDVAIALIFAAALGCLTLAKRRRFAALEAAQAPLTAGSEGPEARP